MFSLLKITSSFSSVNMYEIVFQDCTDEEKVLKFLKITKKTIGPLECSYCGVKRTNVACYIKHLKSCANIVSTVLFK